MFKKGGELNMPLSLRIPPEKEKTIKMATLRPYFKPFYTINLIKSICCLGTTPRPQGRKICDLAIF